ncbi:hypothetical protein HK104_001733 [Borealophlyctis nickersoniae]|nr:hypothetical protein HK104_001733 [Borealophlyctis nickersoniae]
MADDDDFDVDTYLRTQSNAFNQDKEVEELLALHAQTNNPLELLNLPPSAWTTLVIDLPSVKKQYRRRSLLLHPDKCKHPKAQEAFDVLKKAEAELTDDEKRPGLLVLVRDARDAVFRKKGLKIPPPPLRPGVKPTPEEEKALKEIPVDPNLADEIRLEARKIIQDMQMRDRLRLKNDVERKMSEAEKLAGEKKRKQEHDKLWEETRDSRVGNWRKFMKDGAKKKKRKNDNDPYAV